MLIVFLLSLSHFNSFAKKLHFSDAETSFFVRFFAGLSRTPMPYLIFLGETKQRQPGWASFLRRNFARE
jgi:hypothetical protein